MLDRALLVELAKAVATFPLARLMDSGEERFPIAAGVEALGARRKSLGAGVACGCGVPTTVATRPARQTGAASKTKSLPFHSTVTVLCVATRPMADRTNSATQSAALVPSTSRTLGYNNPADPSEKRSFASC